MTPVVVQSGEPGPPRTPSSRDVDRMAAASGTLVWSLWTILVVLVVVWVALALIKHRMGMNARPLSVTGGPAKAKRATVASPWAEAGRRLEVEPLEDGDEDGGAERRREG
ncbi:MAG: hypothetical protein ACT4PL_04465 [Phycisphaerales bacterium]